MSLTPSLKPLALAGLLSVVAATAGCSDSAYESSFVYSEGTLSLMREAQDGTKDTPGVKKLLDDRFGDPQHLKAWEKLPIDFGGTVTSVATVNQSDGGNQMIKLTVEEGQALPKKAATVQFVTGSRSGETVEISKWNAETGEATLSAIPGKEITTGDSCIVDRGAVLSSGRMLYMRHCSHCHGTTGDSNGPTARYMTPKPRDYRNGVFKFTSTNDMSKVSREDLSRIIKYGIPGTYMPSFLLMEDDEQHAIIEYVRFLSMRGEYERKLVAELSSDFSVEALNSRLKKEEKKADIQKELGEFLADDLKTLATSLGDDLAEIWSAAETEEAAIVPSVPRIPDSPESRRRGRDLYLSKTLNCADCHGIDGAGNGPQTIAFEKNPLKNDELYNEPGLHDIWDNLNQPRNLQLGMYRGGRRPIDLFARIHAGINGSRMPSFKNTPHEDIWHLVNYVLSIPFETEPGSTGIPPALEAVAAPAVVTPPAK
ncbi:MAG: cytochrome c [Fuerstia sp.]|nr:cytochrome c [Fuerstiella sp.]